mgnify:CR=1 FL=1
MNVEANQAIATAPVCGTSVTDGNAPFALNASYFNTHRMIQQYATNAYV